MKCLPVLQQLSHPQVAWPPFQPDASQTSTNKIQKLEDIFLRHIRIIKRGHNLTSLCSLSNRLVNCFRASPFNLANKSPRRCTCR